MQDFVSYCRLIRCSKESAGKKLGTAVYYMLKRQEAFDMNKFFET